MTDPFKGFKKYYWDKGVPKGLDTVDGLTAKLCYKIPTDPYHKRYSIEVYREGKFDRVIYDSAAFDFRLLEPAAQVGWQKENIEETEDHVTSLIRSIEDRVVLKEVYSFTDGQCVKCESFSPQELLVSTQRMFYQNRGDTFDGVVLYDLNNHAVTYKRYSVDDGGLFIDLLEEHRSMQQVSIPTE